jgi:hypothetical protein
MNNAGQYIYDDWRTIWLTRTYQCGSQRGRPLAGRPPSSLTRLSQSRCRRKLEEKRRVRELSHDLSAWSCLIIWIPCGYVQAPSYRRNPFKSHRLVSGKPSYVWIATLTRQSQRPSSMKTKLRLRMQNLSVMLPLPYQQKRKVCRAFALCSAAGYYNKLIYRQVVIHMRARTPR